MLSIMAIDLNCNGYYFSNITYQQQENWHGYQAYKDLRSSTTLQKLWQEQQQSVLLINKIASLMQISVLLTITQGHGFIMCQQWNGFLSD
jgi:hypothetical protein